MPYNWLDSNVFIEAKNGPYSFIIAPGFWNWLVDVSRKNLVRSPSSVYGELQKHKDQLARWVRIQKPCGLFVRPSIEVQKRNREITAFVQEHYEQVYAVKFLSGADPWVIAHAIDDGGVVVTHESRSGHNAREVKIPNVCSAFGVRSVRAYDAFQDLGLKL